MSETTKYLGDGAYASFDGYQIWLSVNNHENKVIALEAAVIQNLFLYAESLNQNCTKSEIDLVQLRKKCKTNLRNVTDLEIKSIIETLNKIKNGE